MPIGLKKEGRVTKTDFEKNILIKSQKKKEK